MNPTTFSKQFLEQQFAKMDAKELKSAMKIGGEDLDGDYTKDAYTFTLENISAFFFLYLATPTRTRARERMWTIYSYFKTLYNYNKHAYIYLLPFFS